MASLGAAPAAHAASSSSPSSVSTPASAAFAVRSVALHPAKPAITTPGPIASSVRSTPSSKPRVSFDEAGIAVDYAERGVLYGTQKIDQVDTPFIYPIELDEAEGDPVVQQYTPSGPPEAIKASELQRALGIVADAQAAAAAATARPSSPSAGGSEVEGDSAGADGDTAAAAVGMRTPPPQRWQQAERRMDFEARRRQLYAAEGSAFASGEAEKLDAVDAKEDLGSGLPEGWSVLHSRSDGAPFYFHAESGTTQWKRP